MKYGYVIAGITAMIFCIAILIIIRIREKESISESTDFIDTMTNRKKASLARKPWGMSYKSYRLIASISAVVCAVAAFVLTSSFLYTVLAALVGTLTPELIILLRSAKQKAEFEERYMTALRQLVACLKSGMSIQQAVSDVCDSPFVHNSIQSEFRQIDADIKLGISLQEAFQQFSDRVDSEDAKDVAVAIRMQSLVGGREAETIESIAQNISSRIGLRKEINSMFAGTSMTVYVMDILPFLVILFMYFAAPSYLAPFFESTAMIILFTGLIVFMGVGSVFIHNAARKMKRECGV